MASKGNKSRKDELINLRDSLREDIVQLSNEIEMLAINKSVKYPNKYVPQDKEEFDYPKEAVVSYKELKKLVEITEKMSGIHFFASMSVNAGNKTKIYRGNGTTRHIEFDFQLVVTESKEVQSVTVVLHDKKLEEALRPWIREQSRKKDFQHLMKGIVKYSDVLSQMQDVLDTFADMLDKHFIIEFDITGCVMESKKKLVASILTVEWKVLWSESHKTMVDVFTFSFVDKDLFTKDTLRFWRSIALKNTYTAEEIKNVFTSIVASVDFD